MAVAALTAAGLALGAGVPVLLGVTGGAPGSAPLWQLLLLPLGVVLLAAGGAGAEYLRWSRTRYRIGARRAELHTGLLLLTRRSLARERIRSVDLTAPPLLRVFGLVKVRIGTGEQLEGGESTLQLHPVSRAEGERLRRLLLDRPAPRTGAEPDRHGELARLDWRWIRYAPLSFVTLALAAGAAGGPLQISEWFGAQGALIDWVGDRFQSTAIAWMVVALLVLATAAGVIGSLGLWVELWWGYRLIREPGATLRVRRGLLTSRSLTIEERRLRGVDLVEPLGARLSGGARIDAVATGLSRDSEKDGDTNTLLPVAPKAVADGLAAAVLRAPEPPTGAPLVRHPRAALGRRLRRALGAALLPVAVLAVLARVFGSPFTGLAAASALILLPVAALLARDAYRSLGHALSGDYLVTRSGTVRRSTVALQRSGVIGWTVRQSLFQRRAGLLTLTATTAAGAGGYDIHDADRDEGLAFAATAVPGLLEPFLIPGPPEGGADRSGA
ncbi:PH domain-containing protein [Streptomyces sp. NPDC046887]|uniref:PH domain-containing protein n=1 Tax=Streptomyces sp. NPDC046887 TaxID=3155472 RepID=UPI003407E50C